jgi:hypothetical protein
LKVTDERAGSRFGSKAGSVSQRYRSEDLEMHPDPYRYQNVKDPKHCFLATKKKNTCTVHLRWQYFTLVGIWIRNYWCKELKFPKEVQNTIRISKEKCLPEIRFFAGRPTRLAEKFERSALRAPISA